MTEGTAPSEVSPKVTEGLSLRGAGGSAAILPPYDEGGGFCEAKDGGRELSIILHKPHFLSS